MPLWERFRRWLWSMTCLVRDVPQKNGRLRFSASHLVWNRIVLIEILLLLCTCCSTGNGITCAVNRSAIYVLLFIQIHLCDLMRSLYELIVSGASSSNRKNDVRNRVFKALSTILPLFLLAISYGGTCCLFAYLREAHSKYEFRLDDTIYIKLRAIMTSRARITSST